MKQAHGRSIRCERGKQAREEGANLPTAMVQFCAIISASFHLRAHFWVPHLNFLALLGVSLSKDTLPGPKRPTKQGHPKTDFCGVFFSEKPILTRILLLDPHIWRQLKNSRWPFHSLKIFEAYLINSLLFSEVYFTHSTLKDGLERGIRKFLTFVTRYIASNTFFLLIILKPMYK